MQELLEVFQLSDDHDYVHDAADQGDHQLFLTLSVAVVSGQPSKRSMCLQGIIQDKRVSILIDSGSSHTFVSSTVASQLSGVFTFSSPLIVQVANGDIVVCSSHIPKAVWSIAGYKFMGSLKVLPLSSYDMILGLDWLERFSPMQVDWRQRWLSIPYNGSLVILYVDPSSLPSGAVIQVCAIQPSTDHDVFPEVPPEVKGILEQFASLFAMPSELPPSRACDHAIPLVSGASPVSIRP